MAGAHAEPARAAALADEAMADAEAVGAELRRERERGEALRRAVDEAEAATTRDLERMREEMTLATEATEREAREGAEDATRSKEAAEAKCVGLEQELVLVKRRLEEETATRAANEGAHRETLLDAQRHLATTREHAAALEDECGNLTAQIEAFAVVNARLQEAASSAQSRADAQAAKTSNLQAQIVTLESSTRVGREARVAGETELKARLRNALEELASVIAERDETRLALRETLAKCASAMARSERAETAEARRARRGGVAGAGQTAAAGDDGGAARGCAGAARQAARAERRARGGGAAARRRRRAAARDGANGGDRKTGKGFGVGIGGSGVGIRVLCFFVAMDPKHAPKHAGAPPFTRTRKTPPRSNGILRTRARRRNRKPPTSTGPWRFLPRRPCCAREARTRRPRASPPRARSVEKRTASR